MKRFLALPFVAWCLFLAVLYETTLWFLDAVGLYDSCVAILEDSLKEVSK